MTFETSARLRGALSLVDKSRIAGWVQDVSRPSVPVQVKVFLGRTFVAQVVADRYREDLRRAGIGDGYHGFEAALHCFSKSRFLLVRIQCNIDGVVIGSLSTRYMGRTLRLPMFVTEIAV